MLLPLLLLTTAALVHSAPTGCPDEAVLSQDGSKCFQYIGSPVNIEQAEFVCEFLGPGWSMASVHSKKDNAALLGLTDSAFWLGGNHTTGIWAWADGSAFDFSNWIAGGAPNAKDTDCLAVDPVTGLWYPKACTSTLSAVCEAPSGAFTPEPTGPCAGDRICYKNYTYDISEAFFLTWQSAEQFCVEKFKGHLASVHDDFEEAAVMKLIHQASINLAFLGGIVKNGKVTWSDNTAYDYTHYFPGFDDKSPQYGECVQLYWDNLHVYDGETGWQLGPSNMEGLAIAAICKYPIN